MTRVNWPIGTEVVPTWEAHNQDPSNWKHIYIFDGYPPRARTKAKFTRTMDCPTCGTKGVLKVDRLDPSWFIPTNDPDLPALRAAFRQSRELQQIASEIYSDIQVKYTAKNGTSHWQQSTTQARAEWETTAAYVLSQAANEEFSRLSKAMAKKHHGS